MRQPVYHLRGEAEYFHQLDAEVIESLRRRAASLERRQRLSDASHIHDSGVLELLEKLGYDDATVPLLFIAPLAQVAWADGSISQIERDHIIAIADLRGVKANTSAYEWLMAWFDQRPSNEFFEGTLRAIASVLSSLPPSERKACKDALLLWCRDTAAAPCRLSGWKSKICAAKRKVIREINERLERAPEVAAASAG